MQGEAAYMEDVIKQRQEELHNVEQFMTDINDIAKEINTKVQVQVQPTQPTQPTQQQLVQHERLVRT